MLAGTGFVQVGFAEALLSGVQRPLPVIAASLTEPFRAAVRR